MLTARKRASRNPRGGIWFFSKIVFIFSHFCWVFHFPSYFVKFLDEISQVWFKYWRISHYFDTFQYFQLFYENFQKVTKPDFLYETLRISHNIPYIFSFSKSWSFSYFSNLENLSNISPNLTFQDFYLRAFLLTDF